MRGKHGRGSRTAVDMGITPAHAGKTSKSPNRIMSTRDHPRACGENHCIIPKNNVTLGSPPRMRGKPTPSRISSNSPRITPAHAGKTLAALRGSFLQRDHPRACGENISLSVHWIAQRGSPPRMRGKLVSSGQVSQAQRITPAHAGKTK